MPLCCSNGNLHVMCLGEFHSQNPVQAEPWNSCFCGNGASCCPLHAPNATRIRRKPPNAFRLWQQSFPESFGFLSLSQKQNNPVRLLVLYFKRNRNEKAFGGATLSKNCAALGRFPLACVIYIFFLGWMPCKICVNSDFLE